MPEPAKTSRRAPYLICLGLALITGLAYSQVWGHQFTTWDDNQYITDNPMVRAGLTRAGFIWAFTAIHSFNWHPLTWLSHMLDCQFFGLSPRGPHLVNLGFHLANTVGWFLLLLRLTRALWPSAMVAALFALHPLHVESVAWVAERKDVLSTFFWLAATWAYVRYVAAPGLGRYLLIVACFCLGLLAKPMLVTLPFSLLLLDYWPLGRFSPAPPMAGSGRAKRSGRTKPHQVFWVLIREKIPLFGVAAMFSLTTILVQKSAGSIQPLSTLPLWPRIANAALAYIIYPLKMLWPFPMSFFYALAPIPLWQAAGAILLLILVTLLVLRVAGRAPYLATGWLWYLITLLPVIGLVQVGGQAYADRYTYVPFIGLFIILAWGMAGVTAGWRYRQIFLSLGAGAVLAGCLAATWLQVAVWRTSETLFGHALALDRKNYMAYNHLGIAYLKEGRMQEALTMFHKTIEVSPAYMQAYSNLAITYGDLGRWEEAAQALRTAIRVGPGYLPSYNNLGVIYLKQAKPAEAAAVFETAIRLQPGNPTLYRNLAAAYAGMGRYREAAILEDRAWRLSGR